MVRPDHRAIDHLDGIVAAAISESFQHQVPQAASRPAPELSVHGVPVAQLLGQVTPGRTRAGDPENPVQRAPMVARGTAT
jgi:hypothetical protein